MENFQDRLYKELKKKNINTLEKANEYITNVFLPKYNYRFAFQIDYTKNSFISVDKSFDFNKELAVWSEHSVYHNSYLKYNNAYHIILKDNQKVYLPTKDKVPVYTFLDGSQHILFKNNWYDLKTIENYQISIEKVLVNPHNKVKSNYKPASNHPWKNVQPLVESLRTKIGMYNN